MTEGNESIDGEGEEEEVVIPPQESFHWQDYISRPIISDNGTVPANILEFQHSFGYDCQKRFNLCVADPDWLIFASGNLIHFYNVSRDELTFKRCSTGGGIGHITKNPQRPHIAVGENGIDPPIIVYEWPSMEIVRVLRNGTTRTYSHLRYSPQGDKLVSQGGDPDYLITVWNWEQSSVALQCKSHSQDVYNVVFSETIPGQLVSCGLGHIKCWKMADTFTGLKLQGELGRFSKTEISDIVGCYPMPDEKIVSGCEWGNMLVWNEGLIKIEVCRKSGKPCHAGGCIAQFEYLSGELVTVGTDGWIYFWFYDTIDQSEPSEDNNQVEVEPIYEFSVGEQSDSNPLMRRARLMQIIRRDASSGVEANASYWYAQDGNGGIWLLDLSTAHWETAVPRRLMTCHAGPVTDVAACDWGPLCASCGHDGRLRVYDYKRKRLLLEHQFRDRARGLVWLPCDVEPSGSSIVCGFETGILRLVALELEPPNGNEATDRVRLCQVYRAHTEPIVRLAIDPAHKILVSASRDSTIFVFQIVSGGDRSYPELVPIGYVSLPSPASSFAWKPYEESTLLVGCCRGQCLQVALPREPQTYTKISYELSQLRPVRFTFRSVKSSILREQARLELEANKYERRLQKIQELQDFKKNNPGMEVDEEAFLESGMEDDDALPELYEPEVPSEVLTCMYNSRGQPMLSMSGYDAGYVYEYSSPDEIKDDAQQLEHLRSVPIADASEEEMTCYLFYNNGKYLILGTQHGALRVCRIKPEDEADWSDYWSLPMHDYYTGRVQAMCLGYDRRSLVSCGLDGNVFTYDVNDDAPLDEVFEIPKPIAARDHIPTKKVWDIEEVNYPSLEQVIVKAETDRIKANAKDDKERTLAALRQLTEEYNSLLRRNDKLPASQRLTELELQLDPRISADLDEQLKEQMDIVYRKSEYKQEKCRLRLKKLMEHFIEPITCIPFAVKKILNPESMVWSLRELKLTGDYAVDHEHARDDSHETDKPEEKLKRRSSFDRTRRSRALSTYVGNLETDSKDEEPTIEPFLKGLSPRTIQFKLGEEINLMLKKYRSLKAKLEEQEKEWRQLQSEKPDPKAVDPEDEEAIEHAKRTIGDYKLKASLDLDFDKRPTVKSKYKQIIECRRKIHFRREDFNSKVREMRQRKVDLIKEVDKLLKLLRSIQSELPDDLTKPLPHLPSLDMDIEFPEKKLEIAEYTPLAQRLNESKNRRQSVTQVQLSDEFDEEYAVLMLDEKRFVPDRFLATSEGAAGFRKRFPEDTKPVKVLVPHEVIASIDAAERLDTDLERELKRYRAVRKKHEQDQMLDHINHSYEVFDEELSELELERLKIIHESVYMDLYMLTLHQELVVLKKFEAKEVKLEALVEEHRRAIDEIEAKISLLTEQTEEKKITVARLQEKLKEMMARYLSSIQEQRYSIVLAEIARKSYESSSDASADDAASGVVDAPAAAAAADGKDADKRRSTKYQGDLAHRVTRFQDMDSQGSSPDDTARKDSEEKNRAIAAVPRVSSLALVDTQQQEEGGEGGGNSDLELYEEAYNVQKQCRLIEGCLSEEQRTLSELSEELERQKANLQEAQRESDASTQRLEGFLHEKQRELNNIDMTVILKLDQVQLLTEGGHTEKLRNCIVFDKTRLARLYARVGELQQETDELRTKHKNNKQQLRKIKMDCASMRAELETLKGQIKTEMENKFGQQISLVSLYEAVLRRLIYDIKADTGSLVKFYQEKIQMVKNRYKQQLEQLKDLIKDNTHKLSLLAVLEEELFKLKKACNAKIMSEDEIKQIEAEYKADLKKLEKRLKKQEEEKAAIIDDIESLQNKTKNLLPLDQLLSKTCSHKSAPGRRRPTSVTLIDGKEKDDVKSKKIGRKVRMTDDEIASDPSDDEGDACDDEDDADKEADLACFDENEYYKKVIAVRHLFSQITAGQEFNTKSTIDAMLQDLTDCMLRRGYSHDQIQQSLQDIVSSAEGHEQYDNDDDDDDTVDDLAKDASHISLGDYIYSYSSSFRESVCSQDVDPQAGVILRDLFSELGIDEDEHEQVAQGVVSRLRMSGGDLAAAEEFVFKKAASASAADLTDPAAKTSKSQRIKRSLADVRQRVDFGEPEFVHEQQENQEQ